MHGRVNEYVELWAGIGISATVPGRTNIASRQKSQNQDVWEADGGLITEIMFAKDSHIE